MTQPVLSQHDVTTRLHLLISIFIFSYGIFSCYGNLCTAALCDGRGLELLIDIKEGQEF